MVGEIPVGSKDKIDEEVLNKYKKNINYVGKVGNIKSILNATDLIVFLLFLLRVSQEF